MAGREDLKRDLENALEGEVRFDEYSRKLYSTDASMYRIEPVGVVLPRSNEDVRRALEISARHKAPVISRGGEPASPDRPWARRSS